MFGIGPEGGNLATGQTSQETLETNLQNRLATAPNDTFNLGAIWGIRGTALRVEGEEPEEKIYAIEIRDDKDDPLLRGLQSKDRIVIFDGHSNYGLGPNFVRAPVKTINEFTNFGVGYTDIPRTCRLNHPEFNPNPPPAPEVPEGEPPAEPGLTESEIHMAIEGWGHLQIAQADIPTPGPDLVNYCPPPLQGLGPIELERFPNQPINQGGLVRPSIGLDEQFLPINSGFATWHFLDHGEMKLMVTAPNDDVPTPVAYRTFFYNACNTGLDYIESFNSQGIFVYTTQTCAIGEATAVFIHHIVDGREEPFIVNDMNVRNLGNRPTNVYNIYNSPEN